MIASFRKVFKPTEEDREERVINFLKMLIRLVENKSCSTCKHSECRWTHMHDHLTTETFCTLKNKVAFDTCDNYEVLDEEELMRR